MSSEGLLKKNLRIALRLGEPASANQDDHDSEQFCSKVVPRVAITYRVQDPRMFNVTLVVPPLV